MSRELFLARRLLEAAADPYAAVSQSDEAATELAFVMARYGRTGGYPIFVDNFEKVRAVDFSSMAWLLLLENAEAKDPEVPSPIIEELFQNAEDEIIRLRLVSATLGHPRVQEAYIEALQIEPAPIRVFDLPDCWPKWRLLDVEERSRSSESSRLLDLASSLQELVLYLLQDGSLAGRALAAAAVAPDESWRVSAHNLVRNVVSQRDPNLTGYGRPFLRARL